ncbi:unnamed protein product [Linum tenue]|uniref:Uncharacterized protein n=1 Tax=Linum tenue TaxID=586396 RepID=A0AAV0H451_9ROSI|nr:unnamed protein product [Linum tenue]
MQAYIEKDNARNLMGKMALMASAKSEEKGDPALKLKKKDGGGGDGAWEGSHVTTYEAALEDAMTSVVVKRLKEVGLGKEFEGQMEVVGGIRRGNVCALRAYY